MNLNIKDEFEIDFFAGLFNFLCATCIHDFSDVFLSLQHAGLTLFWLKRTPWTQRLMDYLTKLVQILWNKETRRKDCILLAILAAIMHHTFLLLEHYILCPFH
jgi:hypothetical protein